MPALAESLAEGRLNVEHAAIVADAAEHVTPEVAEALVKTAEAMPADLFARKASSSWASTRRRPRPKNATQAASPPSGLAQDPWRRLGRDPRPLRQSNRRTDRRRVATTHRPHVARRRRPQQLPRRRTHTCPTPGRCLGRVDLRRADGPVRPRHQVHIVWNPDSPATWLDGTPSPTPSSCNSDPQPTSSDTSSTAPDTLWQGRRKRLATEAQWRALIVATRGCNRRRHHRPLPSPPPPRMARRWRHRPPQPRTPLPHLPRSRPSWQPRRPRRRRRQPYRPPHHPNSTNSPPEVT